MQALSNIEGNASRNFVACGTGAETVTDLWARRSRVAAEYERLCNDLDEAITRGHRGDIDRISDEMTGPHEELWALDEAIVRLRPRNASEHAMMAEVLAFRIGDDGIPDDFLLAYCETIRKLALS